MTEIKDGGANPEAPYGYKADGTPKKTRGRPKKSEIEAKKAGNRNKVGRPKGDAAIMNEFKARMLASPKSQQVLETILDAALNDEHKHQAAAWKLIMDRVAPAAGFEKEVIKGGGGSKVEIKISNVPAVQVNGESSSEGSIAEETPLDGEWERIPEGEDA